MNVSSLYTNINQEQGAEAYFKKLEERKNKCIPSIVNKNSVLMILNLPIFDLAMNIIDN